MYWPNPAFKLRLFLILLGGLNALLFTVMEHRHVLVMGDDEDTGTFTKVTAGLSLGLWLCVILLGRLLPTFEGSTSFFYAAESSDAKQRVRRCVAAAARPLLRGHRSWSAQSR